MKDFVMLVLLMLVVSWIVIIVWFLKTSRMAHSKPEQQHNGGCGGLKPGSVFVCIMFVSIFAALMAVVML